ncbi:MAG: DUF1002 domain-containing protein [Gallicola sp.]|nr:DUF1002 domain-containing protein [Gallicola sp.]
MNKFKKIIAAFLLSAMLLPSVSTIVSAQGKIDTTVINERWGQPTFVYGESLSDKEIEETQKLLDIENPDNVKSIAVTRQDMNNYLDGGSNNDSSMISSVIVQKENKGKGITVEIKTPENITQITKEQYRNASITAGVEDATLIVGAVRKVTGESALTGIYKAFEVNGEKLDKDRMQAAQEELQVVNEINQKNEDKDNYSSPQLDSAIVEVKNKLSEIKKENNQVPTKEEITQVVTQAVENNNLQNIVSGDQINQLVIYFQQYVQTGAIDSEQVQKELSKLSKDLVGSASEIYENAKQSGLVDQVIGFFRDLIDGFVNLISGGKQEQ